MIKPEFVDGWPALG